MKKLIILLAAIIPLIIISAHAQSPSTPYVQKVFNNAEVHDVTVQTEGGSIIVAGDDTKNIRVEVYIKNQARQMNKEEIKADVEKNYDLNIEVNDGKLVAVLHRKSDDLEPENRLAASFRIYVPKNVSTDLATSGGDIRLYNLSGTESFVTSGGDLAIDKVAGTIKGATSGGNVVVSNSNQKIDLSTSGGSVVAHDCDGNIDLSTSGGAIFFKNISGRINAGTSSGNITGISVKGELIVSTTGGNITLNQLACTVDAVVTGGNLYAQVNELSKKMKLVTNGGTLDIVIPKNTNADLNINGEKIDAPNMENFIGVKEEKTVRGKLNNGGIPISGFSTSGKVKIITL